jgi:hypothetical protein
MVKHLGKLKLGRPKRKWEDNIKVDHGAIRCSEGVTGSGPRPVAGFGIFRCLPFENRTYIPSYKEWCGKSGVFRAGEY